MIAARHVTGRNVVVCSEHAHSAADKAARMLGMELRKQPADDELRMSLDGLELDDVAAVVATVGTTSFASVDPVRRARGARARGRRLAPRRRRVRRVGVDLRGAAVVVGRHRARRLARRQPAQVAARRRWTARCCGRRRPADFRAAFSLVPEFLRTSDEVDALSRLRARARPPLPLAEAVGGAALLRAEGLRAILREHVRLAGLFAGWVEADPDWELARRSASRSSCFRRERQRRGERADPRARERAAARSSSRTRS